jgi:poly(A) polymerase
MTQPVDHPQGFSEVLKLVEPLAKRFSSAGARLYLVGGVVRDVLMGRQKQTPDFDFTTDALPEEVRSLVADVADAVWLQGERFGTIGVRLGQWGLEITTHRAESYVDDSRKPVVRYSKDLAQDLARRDFTVNAMAVDVVDGGLYDPYGGQKDLDTLTLRTPLDPEESFADDPLRTLRAARFIAGYGFTPVSGLLTAAKTLSSRLAIVSVERVRDELFRLLMVENPQPGFNFLSEATLLAQFWPELNVLPIEEQQETLRRLSLVPHEPSLRLAAVGPVVPLKRQQAWRLSTQQIRQITVVQQAVETIEKHQSAVWSDDEIRHLAAQAGPYLADAVRIVDALKVDVSLFEQSVQRLKQAGELDDLGPVLDGQTVMSVLNLEPGPQVGEALEWLTTLRLDEGRLTPDEVEARLQAWWGNRT